MSTQFAIRGVGLLALAAAINGNALAQSVEPEGAGVPAAAPAPTQATADAPPAVPAETVPAETGVGEAGLSEIIVTATRRDTNLQTTPVAVSAVDSSLINQAAPQIGRAHVELQSLMRISYAVFCLKKKTKQKTHTP